MSTSSSLSSSSSTTKRDYKAKENAQMWKTCHKIGKHYDSDMIKSFREILEAISFFSTIFSAVVTTFAAQTSQGLEPDNMYIMASLLFENNQLLRAVGNITTINEVPIESLRPGDRTHVRADVWANGLLFCSLALSLSTAFFTLVVKQWLPAYKTHVSGNDRDRVLIRQFRLQGFTKWKVGSIIECLIWMLHGSVALFILGLALYVFPLSYPIALSVTFIAVSTYLLFIGSVCILPTIFTDCPYRKSEPTTRRTLKRITAEYSAIHGDTFLESFQKPCNISNRAVCDALYWAFDHSFDVSAKRTIVEAVPGMLDWFADHRATLSTTSSDTKKTFVEALFGRLYEYFGYQQVAQARSTTSSKNILLLQHDFFPAIVVFCLQRLSRASLAFTKVDLELSAWSKLIQTIVEVGGRMKENSDRQPITILEALRPKVLNDSAQNWQERIQEELDVAYQKASRREDCVLSQCLIKWGATAKDA